MFTPDPKRIKIGDRIRITEPLETWNGTYSEGHEFTIIGNSGYRGWDIRDDDGREVGECGMIQHTFEKVL